MAQLRSAIETDRVAHAYLFCGPSRSGKHTTGLALAAALNCHTAPGQGCGTCPACSKIAAGIHPDVQTLERQGAARSIPVDTIRRQVIARMGTAPHEGKARVFLIEEAAALLGTAANALLKTLEEPPARTHFVLATTSPDQLLPTIRSRCQRINFAALSPELQLELAGQADDGDTVERVRALADGLWRAAFAGDFDSIRQAASEAAAARDDVDAILETLALRLHGEARNAAIGDRLTEASLRSHQTQVVLDTQSAVSQQAHGLLAVEAMLHTLRTTLP
ncbi:MAG: DNA polymerase III subunit delta' [Proteobacteria bacterium]|nr:DNA polymerase III subunit delta' [Pseudomonadota bacterium]